jgi:N-acetylneuraminate synthase
MGEASILIDGRPIGAGHPPYIICELSANHNGSLDRMLELVDAAAATGCDAIKIQTYTPDTMTLKSERPEFRIEGGLWDGYTLHELYSEAQTPYEWHPAIFERARANGVPLISTPFDVSAVELLADLDVPAYKIASFELTDLPLIAAVARKGKPMIMSTGLANLAEIDEAVRTARGSGCEQIVLLHCVSSYPAPDEHSNLRTIPVLEQAFGLPVGLSDHTRGDAVSVAAVALGACIVEKHFTLARSDGGPDAAFSLEPDEFAQLCRATRQAWTALGQVSFDLVGQERANVMFRRSIFASRDIPAGEVLSADNVRIVRPGHGLAPKYLDMVLGRTARHGIARGEPITWEKI